MERLARPREAAARRCCLIDRSIAMLVNCRLLSTSLIRNTHFYCFNSPPIELHGINEMRIAPTTVAGGYRLAKGVAQ